MLFGIILFIFMKNLEQKNSMSFIRHSKAGYKTYEQINKSENPQQAVDYDNQIENDLPRAGIELAEREAEKFFDSLNPQEDALFFVSSEEMRALETANIYKEIAKKREFKIIKPEHTRSKTADVVGDGRIRKLNTLSLNIKNTLIGSVFNPDKFLGEINLEAADKEIKEKWDKARKIIDDDDKGSWGANFYYHSEEIKKIFPDIQASKDAYEKKFKNIIKLIKFADQKIKDADYPKNIKVLGFGHENYMGYALNKYFSDHDLKNCETVNFELKENKIIKINYRENEKTI